MKSPLRWIGGKSKLYSKIISIMPLHKCYVEPFAGGLWVLLNKPKSTIEVVNDINEELINFYKVIQNDYIKLKDMFKFQVASRKIFENYFNMSCVDIQTMNEVERAVRFLYLNRCSYGGRMKNFGYSNSRRSNLCCLTDDFNNIIDELHSRLKDIYIESGDYKAIIKGYDERPNAKEEQNVLFYFDPPYYNTYDYEGYKIDYNEFANQLYSIKGKWILTVNDDEYIRNLFKQYNILQISVSETIARTGNDVKTRGELIITNYELEDTPNWAKTAEI